MFSVQQFQDELERSKAARRESAYLRDLYDVATCGLDMKYGTKTVGPHIARRVADGYLVWADEYDNLADAIDDKLDSVLLNDKGE